MASFHSNVIWRLSNGGTHTHTMVSKSISSYHWVIYPLFLVSLQVTTFNKNLRHFDYFHFKWKWSSGLARLFSIDLFDIFGISNWCHHCSEGVHSTIRQALSWSNNTAICSNIGVNDAVCSIVTHTLLIIDRWLDCCQVESSEYIERGSLINNYMHCEHWNETRTHTRMLIVVWLVISIQIQFLLCTFCPCYTRTE